MQTQSNFIHIAFPRQKFLRESASALRYTFIASLIQFTHTEETYISSFRYLLADWSAYSGQPKINIDEHYLNAVHRKKRISIVNVIWLCQCSKCLRGRASRSLIEYRSDALEEAATAVTVYSDNNPRKSLYNVGTYLPNITVLRRRRRLC
jgi:hypothetical protein